MEYFKTNQYLDKLFREQCKQQYPATEIAYILRYIKGDNTISKNDFSEENYKLVKSIEDTKKEYNKYKEGQKIRVTVTLLGVKTINTYIIKNIDWLHLGDEFTLENIEDKRSFFVDKLWFTAEEKRKIEIIEG